MGFINGLHVWESSSYNQVLGRYLSWCNEWIPHCKNQFELLVHKQSCTNCYNTV